MLDQQPPPAGLTDWLASSETGASAKSIVAHLTGIGEQRGFYPLDGGDFGRCERLLDMVPSLRPDLPKMAEVNAYWAALVARWSEIKESKNQTALIKEIISPLHEADPSHVDLGDGASLQFGEITFHGDTKQKMKETPEDVAVRDAAYNVAADELRQFIEQFESLEAEKKDIAEQQKDIMSEAKARGYDTKVLKKIVAIRKRDKDDVAEEEAILDLYKSALGM